jgi:hypothetical protein
VGFPRRIPARPSVRRVLVGLIAGALTLPAVILQATPVAAAPPISLISSSQWIESLPGGMKAVHIVGQIQNTSGGDVALVKINFNWQDASNAAIGQSFTVATREVLGDQGYSPFEDVEFPSPSRNYDHFVVGAITYSRSIAQPYHLDATSSPCPAGDPADEVCGSVTNNGPLSVEGVNAILTYVDNSNTTVGQDRWLVDNDRGGTVFAHGDIGHFKFARSDGHSLATIVADGEPAYPLDVNPDTLDMGRVNVGKTGQQDVTLTNNGSIAVTVGALQATPSQEFSASTDCPHTGLLAGNACHVTVHFTPAQTGTRSGVLAISDNVAGTRQTVLLTGRGTAPGAAFAPASSLDVGTTQRAGAPGSLKTATLVNTGDGPLTITSITTDDHADLSVDGSACPSTLVPGGQCAIGVTFHPLIAGPFSCVNPGVAPTFPICANLVVADDAGTGQQKLPITGSAAGPGAQFSYGGVALGRLDFGPQGVNAPGPPATITLTNNGNEALVISNLAMTGDFTQSNSCGTMPATLAAGANCTFTITFTPSQAGPRAGALTITHNAANLQQSVTLIGTGVEGVDIAGAGRRAGSGVHRDRLIGPIASAPLRP